MFFFACPGSGTFLMFPSWPDAYSRGLVVTCIVLPKEKKEIGRSVFVIWNWKQDHENPGPAMVF